MPTSPSTTGADHFQKKQNLMDGVSIKSGMGGAPSKDSGSYDYNRASAQSVAGTGNFSSKPSTTGAGHYQRPLNAFGAKASHTDSFRKFKRQ